MVDFTVVADAGLRPADLSKLLDVGRVTCSRWLHGHKQPHHLHVDKVVATVDAIKRASDAGAFPVPAHVTRPEREDYIAKVVAEHS